MLGKEIWDDVAKYLSRVLSYDLETIERLMVYFPMTEKDLSVIHGCGPKFVASQGENIIKAFQMVKEKFNILVLEREKFDYMFNKIIGIIETRRYGHFWSISNLCNRVNEIIDGWFPGFEFTTKMVFLFLDKINIINIQEDGNYTVTDQGLKKGLSAYQKKRSDGTSYTSFSYTEEGAYFISTKIVDIIYEFYGFNYLNIYRAFPKNDFYIEKKKYLTSQKGDDDELKTIKRGLIFDLDGTVFDTNCIRSIRRCLGAENISEMQLDDIKLIEGFESLFLNKNSELNLKKNKVLFLTSSPEKYASYLLKQYGLDYIECHYSCSSKKKLIIKNFIDNTDCDEFIAFGDEEKSTITLFHVWSPLLYCE